MSNPEIRTNSSLAEIAAILRRAAEVVVLSHLRPDGDAIGSQLGLALALREAGKSVRCLNEDGVPESLAFLPGAELVESPDCAEPVGGAEVVVACDTADLKRLGERVTALISGTATFVNIDHHISNSGYGDVHYVDPVAPATGQIIHELLLAGQFAVTRSVSENLYIAISTDTGSFQYPNTTAQTYRTAADLIDCGADVGHLAQEMYENYPLRRVRLLSELLNVMEIGNRGRRASWSMNLEQAERLGIQASDTDGMIDHLRSIKGVIVAVFFQEAPDGYIRASLRSKNPDVNVCRVCQKFNGGGHKLAAGVRMKASLAEAQERILTAIDEELEAIH